MTTPAFESPRPDVRPREADHSGDEEPGKRQDGRSGERTGGRTGERQLRPFQEEPANPLDHGGIAE